MRINNIEYDIDSLFEHSNINNTIEAAQKLHEATGITSKEALEIIEKYEIGIIDNNSEITTRTQKFTSSISIILKGALALLIPTCILFLLDRKSTRLNSSHQQ